MRAFFRLLALAWALDAFDSLGALVIPGFPFPWWFFLLAAVGVVPECWVISRAWSWWKGKARAMP